MPFSILAQHLQQSPFLRLLLPLISGILLQWYIPLPVTTVLWPMLAFLLLFQLLWNFLSVVYRFRLVVFNGIFLHGLLFITGALLIWAHDQTYRQENIIYHSATPQVLMIRLEEPLSEKPASYRTVASMLQQIAPDGTVYKMSGKLLLYLQKDSAAKSLLYGDELLIAASLQAIRNSGNPGAFNYQRYCAFQGIYHQAYLKRGSYRMLSKKGGSSLQKFLSAIRKSVMDILHRYIHGPREAGLAAALLIGYKDELDKDLVQSYANTGVVHIIAISGLHLGLIYWLLLRICSPFTKTPLQKWMAALVILGALWLFSMLSGASPSVLRSAVMFTCLVIGNNLNERASIFNTLAASAFILLCYNPFWLWDAGFQLSYAAVLSLVIFMQPVYTAFYIPHKLPDMIWKSLAVTIAAQILTIPLVIYHFHQLPVYVLITNLVAVPLSSIILCGELLLCAVAWIPVLPAKTGIAVSWLIKQMNNVIVMADKLPCSTLGHLSITIVQAACLFLCIAALSYWWLEKYRPALFTGLVALLSFLILRAGDFYRANGQQKLIVYNVPKHAAIDFIEGRAYMFRGDSSFVLQDALQRFYLAPSRILYRVSDTGSLRGLFYRQPFFVFHHHTIAIIDSSFRSSLLPAPISIDILILSHHCRLSVKELQQQFNCRQVVADATHPSGQIKRWRADCRKMNISFYAVGEEGAFVMNFLP